MRVRRFYTNECNYNTEKKNPRTYDRRTFILTHEYSFSSKYICTFNMVQIFSLLHLDLNILDEFTLGYGEYLKLICIMKCF